MNRVKFLCDKTGITGDVRTFFENFKPSTQLPLKDWPDADYTPDAADETVKLGETWVNTPTLNPSRHEARRRSLLNFMLADMNGFEGRMIMFWMNHFGVSEAKVAHSQQLWWWYELIRSNSVGNFKELIEKVTISPAMLVFLDGATSVKGNPNANYARELFELFTLGKGNGYTEEDINEAARALTGFRIKASGQWDFDITEFDSGEKEVFGVKDWHDYKTLINTLFQERGGYIARFISDKLVRYFLGVNDSFIGVDVATTLRNSNWSIKEALITLFTHDEFYKENYVVKSPFDLLKSLPLPWPNDIRYYQTYRLLRERLAEMGQDLLNTPTVAGYEPYRIAPDYDKGWYNTVSAPLRAKLVDDLFDPWVFTMDEDASFFIDAINHLTDSNPNLQVLGAVREFLPFEWPIDQLNKLKTDTLLSGQAEDRYFTNAVKAYQDDPNERNTSVIRERLKALYKTIFNEPSFQLQ
jgi:hypothetical protein